MRRKRGSRQRSGKKRGSQFTRTDAKRHQSFFFCSSLHLWVQWVEGDGIVHSVVFIDGYKSVSWIHDFPKLVCLLNTISFFAQLPVRCDAVMGEQSSPRHLFLLNEEKSMVCSSRFNILGSRPPSLAGYSLNYINHRKGEPGGVLVLSDSRVWLLGGVDNLAFIIENKAGKRMKKKRRRRMNPTRYVGAEL